MSGYTFPTSSVAEPFYNPYNPDFLSRVWRARNTAGGMPTSSVLTAAEWDAVYNSLAYWWVTGYVLSQSAAMSGVTMSFFVDGKIGGNYTAYSDATGYYSQSVIDGWIGRLTPTALVGNATPTNVNINVGKDLVYNFNFATGYLISGLVTNEIGAVANVTMSFTGSAGLTQSYAYTNVSGYYSITAPDNWTGTISASSLQLSGSSFSPLGRTITDMQVAQPNQDFTVSAYVYISGSVVSASSAAGLENVTMSFAGTTSYETYTITDGQYIQSVPVYWAGTVTPSSASATFTPTDISVVSVTGSQILGAFSSSF